MSAITNTGIGAARHFRTHLGRLRSDPTAIADKLAIAKRRSVEDAARLVGWSRATPFRHLRPNA